MLLTVTTDVADELDFRIRCERIDVCHWDAAKSHLEGEVMTNTHGSRQRAGVAHVASEVLSNDTTAA